MASADSEYMANPPDGQERFEAGTITAGAMALGTVLTILSMVFVALRAFTRLSIVKRKLGPDDCEFSARHLIGVSLALAIVFYGITIKLCGLGVGVHLWQVKREVFSPPFLLHGMVMVAVYSLSVTTAKISLLVLYSRLSPERWFRIFTQSLIVFTTGYALAYPFLFCLGCRPIKAAWDLSARPGSTCIDKNTIYLALSVTNIIMDVVCLILPLKIIIPLQMARRQKISLILLFATGGFVCICAIRRTVLLPPLFKSTDYTFDMEKQLNWAAVEVNAGIMCASVPALKPFFVRYLPGFVTSHITGSKSKKSNLNNQQQSHQISAQYSTTIENNKKRRNAPPEAYELHSQEDLSLSSSNEAPKNGSTDDVSKLWSGNTFRSDHQSHRETIIESKQNEQNDVDSSSMDTLGEMRSANAGHSMPKPPRRTSSMRGGITVTTETKIEYERT
ncbi:hypothetical protein CCHL11_03710 [Colletotrichum chlorophyti]|uniref:Rhodopsin domain-containing protein n=1 Tax=Colletotrichum chlorophyti TaxID=708187 RepID=A0A1Q8RSH3_9PEZI|nr:hypothetical protein CCHL11_03710 [Colletotrichum chlorophyti]